MCVESRGTQKDITRPIFQGILNTNNSLKFKIAEMEEDKVKMMMDISEKCKEINDLCEQLDILKQKTDELTALKEENIILLENVQRKSLSYHSIAGDDKMMKFYTGLPNCETF